MPVPVESYRRPSVLASTPPGAESRTAKKRENASPKLPPPNYHNYHILGTGMVRDV